MPAQSLRDYRGRRIVLLVLYTLPASRPRLAQLARSHQMLAILGVGADRRAPGRRARRHPPSRGRDPPSCSRSSPTAPASHRRRVQSVRRRRRTRSSSSIAPGYLRARWAEAGDPPSATMNLLLADIQQLNEEPPVCRRRRARALMRVWKVVVLAGPGPPPGRRRRVPLVGTARRAPRAGAGPGPRRPDVRASSEWTVRGVVRAVLPEAGLSSSATRRSPATCRR